MATIRIPQDCQAHNLVRVTTQYKQVLQTDLRKRERRTQAKGHHFLEIAYVNDLSHGATVGHLEYD